MTSIYVQIGGHEALEAVVMKALEKNREARQHSSADLSVELNGALYGSGTGATISMSSGHAPGGAFPTGAQTANTIAARGATHRIPGIALSESAVRRPRSASERLNSS